MKNAIVTSPSTDCWWVRLRRAVWGRLQSLHLAVLLFHILRKCISWRILWWVTAANVECRTGLGVLEFSDADVHWEQERGFLVLFCANSLCMWLRCWCVSLPVWGEEMPERQAIAASILVGIPRPGCRARLNLGSLLLCFSIADDSAQVHLVLSEPGP